MNKKQKTESYVRFELHTLAEDGKWRKQTASRKDGDDAAAIADCIERYRKIVELNRGLRWLMPADFFTQAGKARICRCTVEVLQEVPRAMFEPKEET